MPLAGPWLDDATPPKPGVHYEMVGLFDVERLTTLRDPLTELPMETYRPAEGLLTRDAGGTPLSEPVVLHPTGNNRGLLTSPPIMLTNLGAARALYGDDCISAVRVRVQGARDMSEESRRRIEWVAKEIKARTDLRVDVTAGSSPARQEVFVAGLSATTGRDPIDPLGYVELPFVKKNVHVSIVRELNRGNLAILGIVLLVAVLNTLTHATTTVYSRLRDMATCRALGWRPSYVVWDVVAGSMVFGGLAAVVGVGLSFWLAEWSGLYVPYVRLLLIGAIAVGVYGLGSLWPGVGAGRVDPMVALTSGEAGGRTVLTPAGHAPRVRVGGAVWGLVVGAFLARWRRNCLTLISLGVATALLAVFLLITLRMQGVMCGTLLGDFLILEITPRHVLTAVLCFGLAAVSVAELMSLSIVERRGELGLLLALGWRRSTLHLMIAGEGAVLGGVGGVIGAGLAVWALAFFYGVSPASLLLPAAAVILVPVLTGFVGALLPSLAAGTRPALSLSR